MRIKTIVLRDLAEIVYLRIDRPGINILAVNSKGIARHCPNIMMVSERGGLNLSDFPLGVDGPLITSGDCCVILESDSCTG